VYIQHVVITLVQHSINQKGQYKVNVTASVIYAEWHWSLFILWSHVAHFS